MIPHKIAAPHHASVIRLRPHVTRRVSVAGYQLHHTAAEVDFGAFGTSCEIDPDALPEAIADVVRAAFANGATRLTIEVAGGDGESA